MTFAIGCQLVSITWVLHITYLLQRYYDYLHNKNAKSNPNIYNFTLEWSWSSHDSELDDHINRIYYPQQNHLMPNSIAHINKAAFIFPNDLVDTLDHGKQIEVTTLTIDTSVQ